VPGAVTVLEHRWGSSIAALGADEDPFEFIFGCDLMYVDDLVPALVTSLHALAAVGRCVGGGGRCGDSGRSGGSHAAETGAEPAGKFPQAAAEAPGSGGGRSGSKRGGGGYGGDDSGKDCGCARCPACRILIAHGRNRGAEPSFLRACEGAFLVEQVAAHELDPVYQCSDVDVLSLTLLGA
jgi:hypothetical protein